MPLYRIEVEADNEGELETIMADGRWKAEVVEPKEDFSIHAVTLQTTDPVTGLNVDVEIRKLESGAMVGFDESFLSQLGPGEQPIHPYQRDAVVVIPDEEK